MAQCPSSRLALLRSTIPCPRLRPTSAQRCYALHAGAQRSQQPNNATVVGLERPTESPGTIGAIPQASETPSVVRKVSKPTEHGGPRISNFRTRVIPYVLDSLQRGELFDANGLPLLSSILLRDACQCNQCIDPSTQQRNFSFVDIPQDVKAVRDSMNSDGSFVVRWGKDP